MKNLIPVLLCLLTVLGFSQDQPTVTSPATDVPVQTTPSYNKVYYGGNIGLSFGTYSRISVTPLIGYRVTPKFSVGAKVAYEYVQDKRYEETLTANNYGGSLFTRYRVHPNFYAHGEIAYMSYQYQMADLSSERDWVPFLLLGGGYVQQIAPRTSFIIEVLVDVLQNEKSPYAAWDPIISIGVGVGL